MQLDEAVRAFLATKPDSGDPAAPVAAHRTAIHAGTDSLFALCTRPSTRSWQEDFPRSLREAHHPHI
ncbi:hypothetical protein [Paractinoplanes hotanensis]|uniref:Uncharacterized protein n=1 Tax=Paractinoplanes hotanensis TaxID=2906497 RepID=A0ABT0XWP9_9ACTN|nr:hypothetical protein [Actinoplanes hotanensis]MCM4078035.1 hypothetical protein [Actinoplanes hotanensis]